LQKRLLQKIYRDTLIILYEVKSLHNRIFLKRRVYTLCMGKSALIMGQIKNLEILFALLTLNFNIAKNKHNLLDSYYQHIINITYNNAINCLSFDDVAEVILEEE
ncbi:hypothetical protein CR513_46010, partial [Mucuna pruriens]